MDTVATRLKWAELMHPPPFQGRSSRKARKEAADLQLDEKLFEFAVSDQATTSFPRMGKRMRAWVHKRAGTIGLNSVTKDNDILHLFKPKGWAIPTERIRGKAEVGRTWQCEECDCDLDEDTALFHYSGLGPYCEDCVEDDEELCGLKWEGPLPRHLM